MAFAYSGIGMHEEALVLYQKALAVQREFGEEYDSYGGTLMDMGYAYNQLGKYKEALPCIEKAAVFMKKRFGEKHQYYAMCMDGEAFVYEHIGAYDKAVEKYKQAFTIYKETFNESHPYCAFVLNNLANLYRIMGRYDEAFSCYHQALAIRKKSRTEDHPDYAQSLANLAALHAEKGTIDSALLLYRQALLLTKKAVGEAHQYYASCLANLGRLYQSIGRYDTSLLLYQQAFAINKKIMGEDCPENVDLLNRLGTLYKLHANDSMAAVSFGHACRLQLKHLSQTYSTLSEGEKLSFIEKGATSFLYLPSYLYERPTASGLLVQQLYQNELSLKAMVMEDQKGVLNTIRQSSDGTALSLYKQWQLNKAILSKQMLVPLTQRDSSFDSLQEATNLLEQELSRRSSAFQNQEQLRGVTVKAIAQKLKKGEAAIEFIRFPYYRNGWTDSVLYAALLLLPGDSIPRMISLCEEKQLQRLLTLEEDVKPAYAIQKIYRPENSIGLDSVYQLVWKPLQKYLNRTQVIYFAPADLLQKVAFNALRDDASRFLIHRYVLHQVLSTRSVVAPETAKSKPVTVSLWGHIQYNRNTNTTGMFTDAEKASSQATNAGDFDFYNADTRDLRKGEFAALPQTEQEIAGIKKTFRLKGISALTVSESLATEERFKALDGKSPQLLHLATHGFFLPVAEAKKENHDFGRAFITQQNPMFRSGLVLAGGNSTWKGEEQAMKGKEDGILTAYEIAQLDLSNTDLVVLSACQTALGDIKANEGVIGLQRAFKLAGVKQMLLSLWSVPDKETGELMAAFYRNRLNGQTAREALRNAQLQLKEKYPPFYWAAFVLIE